MKNINFPQVGELHTRAGRQTAPQDGPVGCTLLRRVGELHIKLDSGKGRARGLPFCAACSVLFCSPPAHPSIFCAACQPAESSRFSFGNTTFQPARPAGLPISVIPASDCGGKIDTTFRKTDKCFRFSI